MKSIVSLLTALMLCLFAFLPNHTPGWEGQPEDLAGPWHLDPEANPLKAFEDAFPGYGEFDASMEIRSDGRISWFIGTDGGYGTYTLEGSILTAQLTSFLTEETMEIPCQVTTRNGVPALAMPYGGRTIPWLYGDHEDPAHGNDLY